MKTEKKQKARKRRGRGEGGVCYREAQGLWEGSISLGYTGDGKRKRKRVFAETKQGVLDEMDRLRAEARSGTLPDAGKLTVGQLLAQWLASGEGRLSASTREARASSVALHLVPRLGHRKLSSLARLHVQALYTDMVRDKVGGAAARYAADCLSAALEYAVGLNLIATNPAARVRKPARPRREMLCLDKAGAQALLAAADGLPCRTLLGLALASGCRMGEMLALTWADLDLGKGTLTVRRALAHTKAGGYELKEPKTAAGRRTITDRRVKAVKYSGE